MNSPSPDAILNLIEAFRRSKAMFSAVALGIFDRLAHSPADSQALALELKSSHDALERLLDSCVSLGLLDRQNGIYAVTPVARTYLCRSSPQTLAGYILYSNAVLYPMWGNLEDAVREGTHRWRQTFALDGPIFSHFFRTEEAMHDFLSGMHGFGLLSSPKVVSAFDLSRFRRLVDLGGATGHLALAACERYRELRATVFDLPAVIDFARDVVASTPWKERIEFIAGNFFTDPLPDADLFAVGRILHDWSEDKIRQLLVKICNRLADSGGLLVAEKLLDDDKSGPVSAHMQSLNMLVCTEGKERTVAEYEALLREAGFRKIMAVQTGAPVDVVLALK